MEPLKGLHAAATLFFALLLHWATYDFFYKSIETTTDPLFNLVLWISYIFIIVLTTLIIPVVIAFGQELSEASIFSMFLSVGWYAMGTLILFVLTPIIMAFVGNADGTGNAAILSEQLHVQIMSIFWLLAVILLLFAGPVIIGLLPEFVYDRMRDG